MKRIIFIAALCALAIGLSGCGLDTLFRARGNGAAANASDNDEGAGAAPVFSNDPNVIPRPIPYGRLSTDALLASGNPVLELIAMSYSAGATE